MVNRVDPGSKNPSAGVHATAIHTDVEAAGTDTQAGAVQPEIEADAWGETDGTAKPKGHLLE
jgi:hypothetical protein